MPACFQAFVQAPSLARIVFDIPLSSPRPHPLTRLRACFLAAVVGRITPQSTGCGITTPKRPIYRVIPTVTCAMRMANASTSQSLISTTRLRESLCNFLRRVLVLSHKGRAHCIIGVMIAMLFIYSW